MHDASVDYLSLGTSKHVKFRFPWKRPWVGNRLQMFDPYSSVFIAGHCNGLVCISDIEKVIVWNPAVRRFRILPDSDDFNRQLESKNIYGSDSNIQTVIGFGFVPSCNGSDVDHQYHYKVVRMTYTNNGESLTRPDYPSVGEIYDSRTDSWKKIGDDDAPGLSVKKSTNNGAFVDGSLYWLGEHNMTEEEEGRFCPEITALDLVDEKFRNIKLPDEFDMETYSGRKIAALGESRLGLFAGDHKYGLFLTVWAMEADQLSWTKLFKINLKAYPLCFSKSGEILLALMDPVKLVMFDPKLRDPCHFQDFWYKVDHASGYMESLLLLDGERREEESVVELEEEEDEHELVSYLFD